MGYHTKSYLAFGPFAKLYTTMLYYKINTNQYTIYNSTKWYCMNSTWLEIATNTLLAFGHGNSARRRDSLLWYLPWQELWRMEYLFHKKVAPIQHESTRTPLKVSCIFTSVACFLLTLMIFYIILCDNNWVLALTFRFLLRRKSKSITMGFKDVHIDICIVE